MLYQTFHQKLKTDLAEVFLSCCEEKLNKIQLKWDNKKSLCIVLCSKGYPDNYQKNVEIENLEKIKLESNDFIFHAGTEKKNNKVFATGGRVLNFISLSDEFIDAKIFLIILKY